MQETKVQEVAKEQFEEVAYLLKALASEIRRCAVTYRYLTLPRKRIGMIS